MDRPVAADLRALLGGSAAWEPFHEGVRILRLHGPGGASPAAAFLEYAPGGAVPLHEHGGREHVFVLAGSQEDERGVYPAGSAVVNPPGSRHSVRSREGCLVLVVWEAPVALIAQA